MVGPFRLRLRPSRRDLLVALIGAIAGFGATFPVYRLAATLSMRYALARLRAESSALSAGCYYSIRVPPDSQPLALHVAALRRGAVRGVRLFHPPSMTRRPFSFTYFPTNSDGVPEVLLQTGTGAGAAYWLNVGLRSHFCSKYRDGKHYVWLHGGWVGGARPLPGGLMWYGGKRYRYNVRTGDWDELRNPTGARGPKQRGG